MHIDITINTFKDAYGVYAVSPEATIWFSPKEGFDAGKLRRTEEDLSVGRRGDEEVIRKSEV